MASGSSITLFSFLTNILRLKSRSVYQKHIEDEQFDSLYVPFMITKWCSMISGSEMAEAISKIQSTLDLLADNPRAHYMLIMQTLPKVDENPRWIFPKKK